MASGCVDGVEQRGKVYYLRWRVPREFQSVETRAEVNRSLRTRCPVEARARATLAKTALKKDWEARLLLESQGPSVDAFQASIAVLKDWGISYVSMTELLGGPIEELVKRVAAIESADPTSAVVPAALGALDSPVVMISDMPRIMEERNARSIAAKTPDQLRQWRNKYIHAAQSFVSLVCDKGVHEITEQDASTYSRYWSKRVESGEITDNHAVKRLRFLRQMIDEYHDLVGTLPSVRVNPMNGFAVKREKSLRPRTKVARRPSPSAGSQSSSAAPS